MSECDEDRTEKATDDLVNLRLQGIGDAPKSAPAAPPGHRRGLRTYQDDCGFRALWMSSEGPSESSEDQAFRMSGGCEAP